MSPAVAWKWPSSVPVRASTATMESVVSAAVPL